MVSAVSRALIRATRMTHHWGPKSARLSRLSSSVQDLYLFLGFFMSFSSTCSLQLVVALFSLLSFLSRLLSLAVSSWVLAVIIDRRESLVVGMDKGMEEESKEREWWHWQGLLHGRSPCFILYARVWFWQSFGWGDKWTLDVVSCSCMGIWNMDQNTNGPLFIMDCFVWRPPLFFFC